MALDEITVTRDSYGIYDASRKSWDGGRVAELPRNPWGWAETTQTEVRRRTPDAWWASAIQHTREQAPWFGVCPLGDFVNFLVSDIDPDGLLVPDDVRQSIEDEAFEAAREVIIEMLNDHVVRMSKAIGGI